MMPDPDRIDIPEAVLRLDQLPREGRDLALSFSKEDRDHVAALLGISVSRLDVTAHAARFQGGIRVIGRLEAVVTQPSVVSFEPVTQIIAEPLERIYLPATGPNKPGVTQQEVFVDLDEEDEPDHIEGNEADLTGLIIETLSLALDPYPRLPGETLDPKLAGDTESDLPFAGLRILRDPDED